MSVQKKLMDLYKDVGIRELKNRLKEKSPNTNFFGRPVKYLNESEVIKAHLVLEHGFKADSDGHYSTDTMLEAWVSLVSDGYADEKDRRAESRPNLTEDLKPKPASTGGIFEKAIYDIVDQRLGDGGVGVDKDQVLEIVNEHLANIPPKKIQINDLPPVEIEGVVHKQFEKIFSYLMGGYHIRIVGPTGSGKTHLVQQLVKARNGATGQDKTMFALSFTEETTKSDMVGRIYPTVDSSGNAKVEFLDGPVTNAALSGSICLLDEEDAGRANVKAILFPLTENGILPVPGRPQGQVVSAVDGFQIIACANTFGNGADLVYVGREQQDGAWLNRFQMTTFYLDYDQGMESKLALPEVCEWAWRVRPMMTEKRIRRHISTRDLITMSDIIKQGLDSLEDLKFRYFMPWEKSERSKISSEIPSGLQ